MLTYTRKPTQVKAVQFTQSVLDRLWKIDKNPNENPITLDVPELNLKKVDWNWHTKQLAVPTNFTRETVDLNDWIVISPNSTKDDVFYYIYTDKDFKEKFTRLDVNYSTLKELVVALNKIEFTGYADQDEDIDLNDFREYEVLKTFADSPNEVI